MPRIAQKKLSPKGAQAKGLRKTDWKLSEVLMQKDSYFAYEGGRGLPLLWFSNWEIEETYHFLVSLYCLLKLFWEGEKRPSKNCLFEVHKIKGQERLGKKQVTEATGWNVGLIYVKMGGVCHCYELIICERLRGLVTFLCFFFSFIWNFDVKANKSSKRKTKRDKMLPRRKNCFVWRWEGPASVLILELRRQLDLLRLCVSLCFSLLKFSRESKNDPAKIVF